MSTLGYFDKVVLTADGRVADAGPVAQVLERQPHLRNMVLAVPQGTLTSQRSDDSRVS